MLLEIIAADLEDVTDINRMEADRIELCGEMDKDGLTPETDLIREAVRESRIPVNIMVRPHDRSFTYTAEEIDQMLKSIQYIKKLGANGIVIGAVTEGNLVDTAALDRLIEAASGLEITFHKAFDEIGDQLGALNTLSQYPQIKTVLTSGGHGSSADNIEQLKKLVRLGERLGITVMPGGGINLENAGAICDSARPAALHFGTGVRADGTFNSSVSEEKIRVLRQTFAKDSF